jgi:hypothetical protein
MAAQLHLAELAGQVTVDCIKIHSGCWTFSQIDKFVFHLSALIQSKSPKCAGIEYSEVDNWVLTDMKILSKCRGYKRPKYGVTVHDVCTSTTAG